MKKRHFREYQREKKSDSGDKHVKSKVREILGIVLVVLAVIIAISLATYDAGDWPGSSRAFDEPFKNKANWLGAFVSYHLLRCIGYTSIAVAILLIITGIVVFLHRNMKILVKPFIFFGVNGLFLPLIVGLTKDIGSGSTRVEPAFHFGGVLGGLLAHYIVTFAGRTGAYLISIASILIAVVLSTKLKPSSGVEFIISAFKPLVSFIVNVFAGSKQPSTPQRRVPAGEEKDYSEDMEEEENAPYPPADQRALDSTPKPAVEPAIAFRTSDKSPQPAVKPLKESFAAREEYLEDYGSVLNGDGFENDTAGRLGSEPFVYVFPKSDLFDEPRNDTQGETREEMLEQAQRIAESLRHFNIESEVRQITPGPIVTRYELTIAPGIKLGRVVGLSNDLTMALRAKGGIRIIAPIPGKAAIGIEVPNKVRAVVSFREIVESDSFRNPKQPLLFAVGKNTSGDPVSADLAQMPHLLIAGSTGSGKSICINTIIASILMRASPQDVRMIMIDPKVVELSIYNPIPHLLTPVITDPKRAAGSLKWAVREMERRYRRLASLGVRDIHQYNEKVRSMDAAPSSAKPVGETGKRHHRKNETEPDIHESAQNQFMELLPFIVVIIDEFCDLMVVASNEIEESIARLAQMARAVGMHLVLATQRPSVDVITGLIKANFPSRIAFRVMQASNSRIILDEAGADKLIGMGDMLFLQSGKPEPVRLHGAFISGDECQRLVDFVTSHSKGGLERIDGELFDEETMDENTVQGLRDPDERDTLFFDAARLVVRHNQGSVSLLQRRLKIGYARAARLIDQLEMNGIVSAYDGSKAREVLVDESYIDALGAGELQ